MKTITGTPQAENYIILSPINWETFSRLTEELSESPNIHLAYNGGFLQIMSPLGQHENTSRFIERIIFVLTEELELNIKSLGSLTLKRDDIQKGVEPDACFYLQNEPLVRSKQDIELNKGDLPPDLVIEIDITSGSLDKLPIYAAIGVPEIWRYEGKNLKLYGLNPQNQTYTEITQSIAFPSLDISLIPQWLQQRLIIGETAAIAQIRSWIKTQISTLHL